MKKNASFSAGVSIVIRIDQFLLASAAVAATRTSSHVLARALRGWIIRQRYDFYVTDVPLRFQTIGERFLGRTPNNVHVVKW